MKNRHFALILLFTSLVARAWAATSTFSNSSSISINDAPSLGGFGTATPYPSPITVSGMSGTISKVTVTLKSLSFARPDDLDILLVAPTSAQLVIMSDVGGQNAVSGITLTLDDAAASQMPDSAALSTGTFQPTSVNSGTGTGSLPKDTFPPPGPGLATTLAAPYGSATFASVFNGLNPNGTWNLYVVDDALGGTVGSFAGGWSLTISTGAAAATTTTVASSLNPSFTSTPNNSVTFTATVTSGGSPVTSGNVTFREGTTTLAGPTALNGSGQAAFTTTSLSEGNHIVLADYGGSAGVFAVSSGSVTQTVDNHTVQTGNQFSNLGAIAITEVASPTPAYPYPSHVFVSGLSGSISKVTVTLNNLTHARPDDLDLLLVGPGGAKMVVMSDVGSGSTAANNVTLTLDDAASALLPDESGLSSGTFRPTSVNSGTVADAFPSPAPASPYTFAAPFGTATLGSVFNGASPNGTWSLYVVTDSVGAAAGSLAGGWSLNFTTTSDTPTTTTVSSSPNPSFTTTPLNAVTFTATVTAGASRVTVGSVVFKEGTTVLAGPTTLNGSGQASFTTSSLTEGNHVIMAEYGGSPGAFNVSSGSVTQTVDNHTVVTGNQYANSGNIAIPSSGSLPLTSTPYPSRIFVAGRSGLISKLTLTLNNFSHTRPDDVDVLLVGPTGAKIVLMSDVGGTASSVNNVTLTLDDAAANALPDNTPFTTGTWKPTSISSGAADAFPSPAPGGPYGAAAPEGSATLATTFNDTDPNGTWSLYVVSDGLGSSGNIAGGWSLDFTGPTVVTGVSASIGDGAYRFGTMIPITVSFDQTVTVTGTPQLSLATGADNAVVNYSSGSGSQTLTFNYTIGTGHTSADLDYTAANALALNGGTIKHGTADAHLTLPAPGEAGSLSANKNIVIDTTSPTVTISPPSATTTGSGPVSYTVTYTDANFGSSTLQASDVTLNATETANGAVAIGGSGDTRTVTISSITGHGTLGITLATATAADLAGNAAPAAGPSATFIVNHPPTANPDAITRYPSQGVKVLVATLLANDTDTDGDVLTLTALQIPNSGHATATQKGSWIVYTPDPGFSVADTFTYTLSDTRGGTATGTVSVNLVTDNAPSQNQLGILDLGGGTFRITFHGIPGRTYSIQYTTDLSNPNWQVLGTATANALGLFSLDDSAGSTSRFYRSTYP